jgi:hypothetical protein
MKKVLLLLSIVALTQTPLLAMNQRVAALKRHSLASKLDRRLLSRLAADTHLSDKHKTQAFFSHTLAIPKPTAIALLTLVLAGGVAASCWPGDTKCIADINHSQFGWHAGLPSSGSSFSSDGQAAYAQMYSNQMADRDRFKANAAALMPPIYRNNH